MIHVDRERHIAHATPEEVFAVLSNPEGLSGLLPRLRKAIVEEQNDDRARLTLCISIGSVFGTVCFAGKLVWEEPNNIAFQVSNPLSAKIQWSLQPDGDGTKVRVTATLDLKPLLGPMIHFVPTDIVQDMIGNELAHALRELERRVQKTSLSSSSDVFTGQRAISAT